MTPTQRQTLVNAGFSRKGLADVGFILDRTPTAKHDTVITLLTTHRAPFKSTARVITPAEIRQRQADQVPGTDAEIATLVAEGIRDTVRAALNRITGRVQ
jgi:hypothetical protein